MSQLLTISSSKQVAKVLLVLLLCICSIASQAQQKLFGNVSVPSGGQITIFNSLNFENGATPQIINAARNAPSGIVNIAANATFTNAGANGHIDGYARMLGSSSVIFPVGHNGFFGPFSAAASGTTGAYFHQNPSSAVFSTSLKEESVAVVTPIEYWDISGANATRITLSWNAGSSLSTLTATSARLTILGWQDGKWVSISSATDLVSILGGASSLTAGSITTTSAIIPDSYDAYTLGFLTEPLPVTLVAFLAKQEGNTAHLTWETSAETNSDRFEIERSNDGKSWAKLGSVESYKESSVPRTYYFTDLSPWMSENFYRLKMVDIDETFAYSSIRLVDFSNADKDFTIYPNPATKFLKIKSANRQFDKSGVRINDSAGRDYSRNLRWVGNDLDVEGLSNGLYILTIPVESGVSIQSKFLIQK